MKILFLDHDGVIRLPDTEASRFNKQYNQYEYNKIPKPKIIPVSLRFDDFNKTAVSVLNNIINETDIEIVVSSDWKLFATLEELSEYYLEQGIVKPPIGMTTDYRKIKTYPYYSELPFYSRSEDLEFNRHMEILDYLHHHPNITNYLAIDDLDLRKSGEDIFGQCFKRDWGIENFILTDHRIGIVEFEKEIIKLLK
jgi:hypothetical protein